MPRYWLIAPFSSQNADLYEKVWQYDLENGRISLGWHELGDISNLDKSGLVDRVSKTYPDKPVATRSLYANMLWSFMHEIQAGDIVLARRGRKVLAGVGKVTHSGYYSPGLNPVVGTVPRLHPNFVDVEWLSSPREVAFDNIVFPMHSLMEIDEAQYHAFTGAEPTSAVASDEVYVSESQVQFALEKHLEEFIVTNFKSIFGSTLEVFADEDGAHGQQYPTDIGIIDILAWDAASQSYVVLELKKGRPSDQVVGQVLRYMGWVKANLCKPSQGVRGLVICCEPDPKLTYAVSMVQNVGIKYYKVAFELRDDAEPFARVDALRHGTWPARRLLISCTARAKRPACARPSAQTLGLMFSRTTALLDSGRAQFDDSSFSFGYGVNASATVDLAAVVRFFGQSFFAESINGIGGHELSVDTRAMQEIDSAAGYRAVVQLLKNDFRMFSVRPVDVAVLEELVAAFFQEVGECRIFSNTSVYSSEHGGDCLGPWTAVTRSSRDTLVCTVSKQHVAYWVYSDDE